MQAECAGNLTLGSGKSSKVILSHVNLEDQATPISEPLDGKAHKRNNLNSVIP